MKRKVNRKNYPEADDFERKQKKHLSKKAKKPWSKRKLSIYDEFEEEDLNDYSFNYNDFEEDEDF